MFMSAWKNVYDVTLLADSKKCGLMLSLMYWPFYLITSYVTNPPSLLLHPPPHRSPPYPAGTLTPHFSHPVSPIPLPHGCSFLPAYIPAHLSHSARMPSSLHSASDSSWWALPITCMSSFLCLRFDNTHRSPLTVMPSLSFSGSHLHMWLLSFVLLIPSFLTLGSDIVPACPFLKLILHGPWDKTQSCPPSVYPPQAQITCFRLTLCVDALFTLFGLLYTTTHSKPLHRPLLTLLGFHAHTFYKEAHGD